MLKVIYGLELLLGYLKLKDGKFQTFGAATGLRDKFIMSLYIDLNNILWVGTNGGGLYKFENDRFSKVLSKEADNDIVFNIVQDQDKGYWLSTNRGAIYFNDSLEFSILPAHGLISNNVFQIIFENSSYAWFASDQGVMRASKAELSALVKGEISELSETRIFDRSDGLRTGQITPASITGSTVGGEIWFCTLEGLAIFDSDKIKVNEIRANTLLTKVISDEADHPIGQTTELESWQSQT